MLFSVQNLSAGYAEKEIIHDISFNVDAHTVLGILGANASGKTTLLKSIGGLLPHSGQCSIYDESLEKLSFKERAKRISWIPQRSILDESLSVLDIVLMGFTAHLSLFEQPSNAMRQCAIEAIETVGLANYTDRPYQSLSEGQKQLCIWARTLITGSRVMLLDEPESALDFHQRRRMLHLVTSWVHDADRCAVIVLHDPQLAFEVCDCILLLKDGRNVGKICPKVDSISKMNRDLKEVFTGCTLYECVDNYHKTHLILLNEPNER